MKLLTIIIMAILLISCSAVETTNETTNEEQMNEENRSANETVNEEDNNTTEIKTEENNTTEIEAENDTIENETLIGEPAPETIIRNDVSENFIKYEFEHSDKDVIRATLNGEVIFDSEEKEEKEGTLRGYQEKGNTLSIEFTDYPDNTTVAFRMLLNGEEQMLAWRRYNASGSFEAPLDFIIEEGQE